VADAPRPNRTGSLRSTAVASTRCGAGIDGAARSPRAHAASDRPMATRYQRRHQLPAPMHVSTPKPATTPGIGALHHAAPNTPTAVTTTCSNVTCFAPHGWESLRWLTNVLSVACRTMYRDAPVPGGPLAYRRRLLRLGPLAGLVVPMLLAGVSWFLSSALACEGADCARPLAGSWATGVMAAPTSLAAGLPWHAGPARWLAVGLSSAIVWLTIGGWCAQRAVRFPVATWREFWREYRWLGGAVFVGALAGLAVMALLSVAMP
jgi:hypothetical protein